MIVFTVTYPGSVWIKHINNKYVFIADFESYPEADEWIKTLFDDFELTKVQ